MESTAPLLYVGRFSFLENAEPPNTIELVRTAAGDGEAIGTGKSMYVGDAPARVTTSICDNNGASQCVYMTSQVKSRSSDIHSTIPRASQGRP